MANGRRAFRLFCTARDPGAAEQIGAVAVRARELGLQTQILASGPALGIMRRAGLAPLEWSHGVVAQDDPCAFEALVAEARRVLCCVRPDAVLVGLSHFAEVGVDEAVAAAWDGPLFAFQDFWGDVDPRLTERRATIFVLDAEAERLTREKHDGPIVVVGSPKHARFAALHYDSLRAEVRRRLDLSPERIVIGYFGQDLDRFAGYRRQIAILAHTVREKDWTVLFRPHPRESEDAITRTVEAFRAEGVSPAIETGTDVAAALAACDVVLSCFSTCGLDALHLARFAGESAATVGFLQFESDIGQFTAASLASDGHPLTALGLAFEIRRADAASAAIAAALDPARRTAITQSARARLADPSGSADRALAAMMQVARESGPSFPDAPNVRVR